MLNTKITDKTPMVDILKKVEAEVFVGNDTTDPYEVAQALIKNYMIWKIPLQQRLRRFVRSLRF